MKNGTRSFHALVSVLRKALNHSIDLSARDAVEMPAMLWKCVRKQGILLTTTGRPQLAGGAELLHVDWGDEAEPAGA